MAIRWFFSLASWIEILNKNLCELSIMSFIADFLVDEYWKSGTGTRRAFRKYADIDSRRLRSFSRKLLHRKRM